MRIAWGAGKKRESSPPCPDCELLRSSSSALSRPKPFLSTMAFFSSATEMNTPSKVTVSLCRALLNLKYTVPVAMETTRGPRAREKF